MTPKNRKRTFIALLGGALGLVGIGLAAALLTATISGSTSYADTTGGFKIDAVTGSNAGTVNCADSSKVNDNEFRIRAVVQRVNGVVQPGSCQIKVNMTNPGNTAINFTGGGVTLPAGWSTSGESGPTTLAPGQTGTYTVTLNASDTAAKGEITGSITAALAS